MRKYVGKRKNVFIVLMMTIALLCSSLTATNVYATGEETSESQTKQARGPIDFGDWLTSVSVQKLSGTTYVDVSDYTFTEGDGIRCTLAYTVPTAQLDEDSKVITYTLPRGVTPNSEQTGAVLNDGETVGEFKIETNGKITITFNEEFVESGRTFNGTLWFDGTVLLGGDSDEWTITFPGSSGTTIKVKKDQNKYDLSVNKTNVSKTDNGDGTYTLEYSVSVSSEGGTGNTPVTVNDILAIDNWNSKGTYSYDQNSFVIKKGDTVLSEYTPTFSTSGTNPTFSYTDLPPLDATESYVVTYKVNATENKYTEGSTGIQDGSLTVVNKANANGKDQKEVVWEINHSMIAKSGSPEYASNRIKWTITINPDQKDISGYTLKDVLSDTNITLPSSFTLNGTTVNVSPDNYVFEDGSEKKYTIEYYTDMPSFSDGETSKTITNTTTIEKDGKKYLASIPVTIKKQEISVSKNFRSATIDDNSIHSTTWMSTVDFKGTKLAQNGTLTYEDALGDITVTDESGTSQTITGNGHYAVASELENELKEKLTIYYYASDGTSASSTRSSFKYGENNSDLAVNAKYYDEGGNAINRDSTSHVKSFKIELKANSDVYLDKMIISSYTTHADLRGLSVGNTATVKNTAKIDNKSVDATYTYTNPRTIVKQVKVKDAYNNYNWQSGDQTVKIGVNGILHYRVLLLYDALQKGTDTFSATDTLPDGLTYVDGSAKAYYTNGGQYDTSDDGYTTYNPTTVYSFNSGEYAMRTTTSQQVITFSINNVFLDCPKSNGWPKYISIEYDASINNDSYWSDATHTEKEYENKAAYGNIEASQKTTVQKDQTVLTKTGEQLTDTSGNNTSQVRYRVVINPSAQDIDSQSTVLKLTDKMTLPSNLKDASISLSTAKLYAYSGDSSNPIKTDNDNAVEINENRYKVIFTDGETKTLNIEVPDELACVFEYTYDFNLSNQQSGTELNVQNTVSLLGTSYSKPIETKIKAASAGGTASHSSLRLNKVDSENQKKLLPGATFKLWSYNTTSGEWDTVTIQPIEGEGATLTDDTYTLTNGYITFSTGTGTAVLRTNTLYRLQEQTAPANYTRDETNHYFVVDFNESLKSQVRDPDVQWNNTDTKKQNVSYYESGGEENMYFSNENTSITVNKVWLDTNGNETAGTDDVTVQLQRSTGTLNCWNVNLKTTFTDDNGTKTFGETSVQVKKDSKLTISIPKNYGGNVDKFKILINNEEKSFSDKDGYAYYTIDSVTKDLNIEVKHYWDISNDLTGHYAVIADDDYVQATDYILNNTEDYGDPVTLTSTGNYSNTWTNIPKVENGITYFYTVKETSGPSGYTTSYTNNGGIQKGDILITNKRNNEEYTSLTVQKEWKDASGNAISDTTGLSEVQFHLVQWKLNDDNSLTRVGNVTKDDTDTFALNTGNNYQMSFDQLMKKDASGISYYYTVEENDFSGYKTSYTFDGNAVTIGGKQVTQSGTLTISNKANEQGKTSIKVNKTWLSYSGKTISGSQNVTVTLNRYIKTDETYQKDTSFAETAALSESNGYSYTWDTLDAKDTSGNDYYYTVTETKLNGYTVTYDGNETSPYLTGGSVSLTNKKTEADKTSIVVKKVWKDSNGTTLNDVDKTVQATLKRYTKDASGNYVEDTSFNKVTVTLSKANSYTHAWNNLVKEYAAGEYYYSVEETGNVDGYHFIGYLSGTVKSSTKPIYVQSGTVTLTNQKEASQYMELTVKKNWLNSDGNVLDSDVVKNAEVKVAIDQYKYENGSEQLVTSEFKTLTLNADNSFTVKQENLPKKVDGVSYGYKVREVEVNGIDDSIFAITDPSETYSDTNANVVITNKLSMGAKLSIRKTDKNDQTVLLANASFEVEDASGNVVDTITTGNKGIATSKELPLGTYTVTETKAPEGYSLDTTPKQVTLALENINEAISITFEDEKEKSASSEARHSQDVYGQMMTSLNLRFLQTGIHHYRE